MSDEEGGWMDDAEDEEKSKVRKEEPPVAVVEKTEAQLIIEAKQRKHEEEDSDRLREVEEQRRIAKAKEDEELRKLKEKQAQRKKEREEEERMLEEQKKLMEEQRRKEEEERKQKIEDDKRRKLEEAERKKAAAQAALSGGRNFVIEKEKQGQDTMDKFMNISKAQTEMSLNTGELEALKKRTMMDRIQPLSISGMDAASLKAQAEKLWKKVIELETAKYDLDERSKRQEYDLKELNERQRQMNMKKYISQGMDPNSNTRYPPKVQLISKYERRTDRRSFVERKSLFQVDLLPGKKIDFVKPGAKKRDTWIKDKAAMAADDQQRELGMLEDEEEEKPGYSTQRSEQEAAEADENE